VLKGVHLTLMMGPTIAVPVPQSVIDALTNVQVTVSSGQRSGFQLTFAIGKNSPLNTRLLPGGFFDAPNRVIIVATLNGTPNVLMDGVITQQTVAPSNEPGQSTLTVTGEDISRMMELVDLSGLIPYPGMPAEARVAAILVKYAMYGVIPKVIPSISIFIENPIERIPYQEGNDFQYITSLASEVGYVFYMEPGPVPGTNIAYWGPEIKTGAPQPALSVNMDAETNVESLNFSFDGFSKTLYYAFVHLEELRIPIPVPIPDVNPLSPPLGQKMPIPLRTEHLAEVENYPLIQAAAVGLAKAAQSADVVSASGQLDVLRYGQILRARGLVTVRGAGITYDGLYYVKSVTHNIKRGEYKQSFTLSRNALITSLPKVPI
jgi:hypothetical protein